MAKKLREATGNQSPDRELTGSRKLVFNVKVKSELFELTVFISIVQLLTSKTRYHFWL